MKANRSSLALTLILTATILFPNTIIAQGTLDPPGAPLPSMKSLQEIWDKLEAVEARNIAQEAQIAALSEQLQQQGTLFHYASGESLPWLITTVDDTAGSVSGKFSSLAFGPDGQPAISYYEVTAVGTKRLRFATHDGNSWSLTTVDQVDDVGQYSSLAFNPLDGHPAICYYDATSANLKFASYDGNNWSKEVVASRDDVGQYCTLAFGPDGQPAIAYYAGPKLDLKLARYDGASWSSEPVDSSLNDVGTHTSLAFDPDTGQPAISYYDATAKDLKFASFDGASWSIDTVDSTNDAGQFSSLAFAPDGQPAISYYSAPPTYLKFARYVGGSWSITTIDAPGTVGLYSSLAFGPDGMPAISYYDQSKADLKFARMGVFPAAP